jgi:hypothetical protein
MDFLKVSILQFKSISNSFCVSVSYSQMPRQKFQDKC